MASFHNEGREKALEEVSKLYAYIQSLPSGAQKTHFLKKVRAMGFLWTLRASIVAGTSTDRGLCVLRFNAVVLHCQFPVTLHYQLPVSPYIVKSVSPYIVNPLSPYVVNFLSLFVTLHYHSLSPYTVTPCHPTLSLFVTLHCHSPQSLHIVSFSLSQVARSPVHLSPTPNPPKRGRRYYIVMSASQCGAGAACTH